MADEKVRIILEAKNNASSGIKQVNSDLANLQSSVAGLVKGVGLAALAFGIIDVGKSLFAMSQEAQYAVATQNQLDAVLRSTGGVAGVTAAQVNDLASKIQELTNFGDEEARSAQSLLLTFTKIGSDVFPRATMAAVDMSAAFGQDLKSSVIQLGKALNDPIEGIGALSRIGVQFSDSQKQIIESMMEVNDIAGAQAIILKEVETQVKGSAEAQVSAVKQAENAWGDLREEIGMLLLPTFDEWAKTSTTAISSVVEKLHLLRTGGADFEVLIKGFILLDAVFKNSPLYQATTAIASGLIGNAKDAADATAQLAMITDGATAALIHYAEMAESAALKSNALTVAAAAAANQMARTAIISAQIAEERGDPDAQFRARLAILQRLTQATKDANADVGRDNEKLADEMASAYDKAARDTQSAWEKTWNDLKAKVSSVLSGSLSLSPISIKSEDLLPREDAIQEDAFRLADVAVNGFASPWADYLNNKFPGMFGEAFEGGDIKTKAAQLLKDFEDGLNPQLIDKDKAKERVKRMILGEASMAELAAQVTAELQAELGGAAPADLAAKVQQALGGGTGGAETGSDFAATTLNAVITSDVGGNMVATVVNQAAGKAALVKASGESSGKLWGSSVLSGAQQAGVPEGLIALLVGFLWPAILAKMQAQKTKTGTVEAQ